MQTIRYVSTEVFRQKVEVAARIREARAQGDTEALAQARAEQAALGKAPRHAVFEFGTRIRPGANVPSTFFDDLRNPGT